MLIYPKGTPPTAFHQTSQTVCQLQLDIPRIPKKDLSPSKFLHNLDKSSLISTQHIRPFSVVQEGSYKVRKKGMQTNLTDFFSSFRKVFSRLFFKTRIRGKGRFLPKPAQPNLYCKGNKPITKNHTVMFTYWKVADDNSDQLKDQEQIFWVLWRIETNFIMYKKFDEFNTTSDIIINVTAYSLVFLLPCFFNLHNL